MNSKVAWSRCLLAGLLIATAASLFATMARATTPCGSDMACSSNTPRQIIHKLDCVLCHQFPGIPFTQTSQAGPLLLMKTLASQRLSSPAYRARIKEGTAHAKSPKEYVIESIVEHDAFVVPGFTSVGGNGSKPSTYLQRFTYAAVSKLADYLLTLDCKVAKKENLTGPSIEPRSKICGE